MSAQARKQSIKLASRDGSDIYAVADLVGSFGIHRYQYGVTLTHIKTGLRLTHVIAKPRGRAKHIAKRIALELETLGDWSTDPINRELLKATAGVIIRIMKEEGIWE